MERKLTAILCADVFGYSRLMGEDEEATLRTLSSHRKLIDSLIEQRHGRFVNSAGDSVLAEFASVVNAVQCAVEIKTTLKAENGNIPLSGEGIPQFGINTDDVRVARQERQRPLRTALIAHFSQSPMRPSESPDPAASRLSCDPSAQFSCLSMEPDREKSPAILPVVSVTKEIMDVKT